MIASSDDRGIAAVWVAILLVFLMGTTAIAVDASGFFQQATSQQRAADLACLAGAAELPGNPTLAIQKAADYIRPNQLGLHTLDETTPDTVIPQGPSNGTIASWTVDDFVVEIETPVMYGGTLGRGVMRVTLRQKAETNFAKVIGFSEVDILEEAYCGAFSPFPGGVFPVAVPNGWGGGPIKFAEDQCGDDSSSSSAGVCNLLDVPRQSSGSPLITHNLMRGSDWPLEAGNPNDCDTIDPLTQNCGLLDKAGATSTGWVHDGLIAGKDGYLGRLQFGTSPNSGTRTPFQGNDGTAWSAEWKQGGTTWQWNSNTLTQATDFSCKDASPDTDWFMDGNPPTQPDWSGAGEPEDPPSDCSDQDLDDQWEDPDDIEYVEPPHFEISRFNCEDLRFVVMPEGHWTGPSGKDFQIDSFVVGYLHDPIFNDDDGDGERGSSGDTNIFFWDKTPMPGEWEDIYPGTSIKQMSAFKVEFRQDSAGNPNPTIEGSCEYSPFPESFEGLIPKIVRLVPAP